MKALDDPGRNPRVRLRELVTLAEGWSTLRRARFEFQGRGGRWSSHEREAYDRGNGAVVLLFDSSRGTVLLTRQFRLPVYLNGHADGMLIEAPAGVLDAGDVESEIRREVEEETGYRVETVRRVYELFMSPGSVTERIVFFTGSYSRDDRVSSGGGVAAEGEEIEVIELELADALELVERGEIVDAKTVLLLWKLDRDQRRGAQTPGHAEV